MHAERAVCTAPYTVVYTKSVINKSNMTTSMANFFIVSFLVLHCAIGSLCSTNTENATALIAVGSNENADKPFKIDLTSSIHNITPSANNEYSTSSTTSTDHPVPVKRKVSSSSNIQKTSSLKTIATLKPKPERDFYECPNTSQFEFFPAYCTQHTQCLPTGRNYRCCNQFGSKRCVKGIFKPLKEQKHEPILGLIPRKCPIEPLAEIFFDVHTCQSDQDCWPRICCPDGRKKYCRTSKPELDNLPVGRQLAYPIESITSYLQCTPAPPKAYDAFPKTCNNTLDCFPNVCCQEAGKKHCRPPKRSLLAFVTGFAQQFNRGIIKQWTDNLVIRR